MKGLRKRYKCIDHLVVAAAKVREGDSDGAEEHLSKAVSDPDLDEALDDIDVLQDEADADEDKDDSEAEEATAPSAEEEQQPAEPEEAGAKKSKAEIVGLMMTAISDVANSNGYPGWMRSGSDSDDEAYAKDLAEMLDLGFPIEETASEESTEGDAPTTETEEATTDEKPEVEEPAAEEASMVERVADRVARNLSTRKPK